MDKYLLTAIILGVLFVAALIFILVKSTPKQRQELINKILYSLAVEAERLYGGKTGQVKKTQVIAWFYERYKWLSWLIPESTLGEWIDTQVANMNEWMKSNPVGAKNLIGQ